MAGVEPLKHEALSGPASYVIQFLDDGVGPV